MRYKVKTYETLFYLSKEVKASSKEEASDKYLQMIEEGKVPVSDSDLGIVEVEEIGE